MLDPNRRSTDTAPAGYWDPHYQGDGGMPGPLKVHYRRALNYLLDEGVDPLEVDPFAVAVLREAGVESNSSKVDVGSGGEFKYSYEYLKSGDKGPQFAVEPNPQQAPNRPYLAVSNRTELDALKASGNESGAEQFYRKTGAVILRGILGQDITLIKSDANFLPFPSRSIGAVTWLFSGYHIAAEKQLEAFREARRVLAPNGIYFGAFSNRGSKSAIRAQERMINEHLSNDLELETIAPIPISAGLVTEEAVRLASETFDHVWLYEYQQRILFNTPSRIQALYLAHTTTRDLYRIPTGIIDGEQQYRMPTKKEFDGSYAKTVGKKVREAGIKPNGQGGRLVDFLRQGFILGANHTPENIPDNFVPVHG